jgi:hypothetical protein
MYLRVWGYMGVTGGRPRKGNGIDSTRWGSIWDFGFCFRIATQWQKYGFDLGNMGLEPCNYYYNNFILLLINGLQYGETNRIKPNAIHQVFRPFV